METVQLAPALKVEPHVVVFPKAFALAPVTPMLVMLRVVLPVFKSVTVWAELVLPRFWLAKVMLTGLSDTSGPVPVPVRATDWGLLAALSEKVKEAVLLPGPWAANVTETVQLALALKVAPQV
jgi:hypothetical protein